MAILKLNNTTVFTESSGTASITGNVEFPAGKVLQSTQIYTSSYVTAGMLSSDDFRYLVNGNKTVMSNTVRHGTGTDIIATSNDYVHKLTAKQSNSIYRLHLTMPIYITNTCRGHFNTMYAHMQYSTSPTSGYTTVEEDSNDGIFHWYQDNRSTYGNAGQDLHRVSGFDDFYSSFPVGTTIYFNVKVRMTRVSTERFFKCFVEEIAT